MFLWLSFQSIFSFDKMNRASTGVVETFEADVRAKDRARVTEILNSRWYIKPDIVQKNILSEGSYGVAFKIVTRSGDQMVMKSSKKSGPFASSDFVRELSVLERFAESERADERIVKLVGANMDDGFNIFVKYYEKNDLVSFVRMHGRRLSVYHKRRIFFRYSYHVKGTPITQYSPQRHKGGEHRCIEEPTLCITGLLYGC